MLKLCYQQVELFSHGRRREPGGASSRGTCRPLVRICQWPLSSYFDFSRVKGSVTCKRFSRQVSFKLPSSRLSCQDVAPAAASPCSGFVPLFCFILQTWFFRAEGRPHLLRWASHASALLLLEPGIERDSPSTPAPSYGHILLTGRSC